MAKRKYVRKNKKNKGYKENRARGTRKSTYKKEVRIGQFIIPERGKKSNKAYLEEFIQKNKTPLKFAYERELDVEGEAFRKKNPNVETYVKRYFSEELKTHLSKRALRESVGYKFAPLSQRQAMHIADLISKNEEFFQELQMEINDEFDWNNLSYVGNNVFTYTTPDGRVLRFAFSDYSGSQLRWISKGERNE